MIKMSLTIRAVGKLLLFALSSRFVTARNKRLFASTDDNPLTYEIPQRITPYEQTRNKAG